MKTLMAVLSVFLFLSVARAEVVDISVSSAEDSSTKYYDVNFGSVWVNSRSGIRYKITNKGPEKMTFQKAIVWGGDFEAYHDCKVLEVNQVCTVDIYFWPMFEGFKTGDLLVRFDSEDLRFRLSGWATK